MRFLVSFHDFFNYGNCFFALISVYIKQIKSISCVLNFYYHKLLKLYLVHPLHIIKQTNFKGMLSVQKGRVMNLSRLNKVFSFLHINCYIITLTVMCILGIAFGIFGTKFSDRFLDVFKNYTENFLLLRSEGTFLRIFSNSLFLNFTFSLLIFIFGTSVTGITLAPILVLVRSLIFGALSGIIYANYSLKGIALNALLLIPPTVIAVIFIILSAKEAMKLSLVLIGQTLPETKPKNLSFNFSKYCVKNLILFIPIIISSVLDGWLSIKLISFFELQL